MTASTTAASTVTASAIIALDRHPAVEGGVGRVFRVVYALLVLHFGSLGITYLVAPATAVRAFSRGNELLGGLAIAPPDVPPWRYATAVGMTTLAFMCLLLLVDLRRNYPILIPAAFFKSYNAVLWFAYYSQSRLPVFLAAGVFDVVVVVTMIVIAQRAHAALP